MIRVTRKSLRALIVIGSCLAPSMFLGARPVFALAVSSSQPIIRHELAPGETIQGTIEVSSHQDDPLHLRIYLEDWRYKPTGDGEKDFGPPQTMPRSAAGWISFYPSEVDLPGRGKAVIDYTIRVPENSSVEGEYVAVLFLEAVMGEGPSEASADKPSAMVKFAARLGSLIYVDVKNTVRKEGRFRDIVVNRASLAEPPSVKAKLANEGNAVLLCEGAFHVMDEHNVITARGQLPTRWMWPGDQVPVEAPLKEGSAGTLIMTYDCGEDLVIVEELPLS